MQFCFKFIAIIFLFVILKPQNIRCTFLRINGFELETPYFLLRKKGKSFISFDFQVKSFRINILVWFQNLNIKRHCIISKDANRTSMEQRPKFRPEITQLEIIMLLHNIEMLRNEVVMCFPSHASMTNFYQIINGKFDIKVFI